MPLPNVRDCKLVTFFSATRLRAKEKLIANLQYEDETSEADDEGFCFPRATSAELHDALEALLRREQELETEEEEVVEEEEVIHDWEELQDIYDDTVLYS